MNLFTLPRLGLLASLLFAPSVVRADNSSASYPPGTIPHSQLRVLPKSPTGRQYQLHVGLPGSYGKDPQKKYPVVYVTDGYWDFQKITGIYGALLYDRVVPEFITVGIGYPGNFDEVNYGDLRWWELSPIRFERQAESGHAAEFLQSIEREIIPYIEREFRVDPSYRVMAGASLGGLFTLYAMYSKPGLFNGYVALTPAVFVGNDWLLGYDAAFAAQHRPIKARLFIAYGGDESPNFVSAILRYNQRPSSRKYPGLSYQFRVVDGERHAGMQHEGYSRGLRWVFAPLAPESGPSSD